MAATMAACSSTAVASRSGNERVVRPQHQREAHVVQHQVQEAVAGGVMDLAVKQAVAVREAAAIAQQPPVGLHHVAQRLQFDGGGMGRRQKAAVPSSTSCMW
jgi:hypothetical protein